MTDSPRATALYGGNAAFLEELYEAYLQDPASVDPDWRDYFDGLRGGADDVPHTPVRQAFYELARAPRRAAPPAAEVSAAQLAADALTTAYRVYGHLAAQTNPIAIRKSPQVPELSPEYYGLSERDLEQQVGQGGTLREVIAGLRETYCGAIGFEFSYLPSKERAWLQERIEADRGRGQYSAAERRRFFEYLNRAEGLERYLHIKYVGQKRFSLEGSDTFIPLLDRIVQQAGVGGVKEVVVGMAHRGRLNVLVNIFGKKASELFAEFEGKKDLPGPDFSGDVKYHMGFSSNAPTPGGPVHLALAFNPSHLEIVSPVVHGSARARQDRRGDTEARRSVLPITVHGDAAVSGQGVVMETLNLSQLRGFSTGGAVRIVINNQVGFTISDPRDTRSSRYCTDVAKIASAPVLHVNGDDPEAVAYCADLAVAYRQQFGKDIFIDLISFRRHGHNEGDDPTMTQPIMYRAIKAHPGARALYAEALEKDGVLESGEAARFEDEYRALLDRGEAVHHLVDNPDQAQHHARWERFGDNRSPEVAATGVPLNTLQALGERLSTVPEDFAAHRGVGRVLQARRKMAAGEQPLDWGMGEMLAYASLLAEGHGVRLVGQDSGRGTFVHRHAVLHDQQTEDPLNREYMALAELGEGQGRIEVIDSTLSEEAVMAFEYGYSLSEPNTLVAWEAQFGDFANGAQAVIDQFLASGEAKWGRYSGLTLLLPHGYEGAGPEHSSARLERFLQLCAQQNMRVAVPSSPAQMFHLLRRQLHGAVRKPLIVMTPKSLLRHRLATSTLQELSEGHFREVIGDDRDPAGIGRVVVSSGKLHWELFEAREKEGVQDTALIRLEQLYPFPAEALQAELARYPGATVVWAQEEPQNQGAWLMIRDDLETALAPGQRLRYVARPRMASTAAGYSHVHVIEQARVIAAALAEPLSEATVEAQVELEQEAQAQG